MLLAWAIIALLILFTGLYVAAEFAAVSARRSRLRRLAEDGNVLAARILPVLEDPRELDRYIAASQVGITLSSLILGAYGQATLAPRISPLFERFWSMQRATAESTSAAIVLVVPHHARRDPRGARPQVARAAEPDRHRAFYGAADAMVDAGLLMVNRRCSTAAA